MSMRIEKRNTLHSHSTLCSQNKTQYYMEIYQHKQTPTINNNPLFILIL